MAREQRPQRPIDVLAARMKAYEAASDSLTQLDATLPTLVRIDGHKFSTFTRGFQKPFDRRLHAAMQRTTQDLVERFQAVCGFTESDEITLVLAPCSEPGQTLAFSGRVTKLASVVSGYTSVRFAYHLQREEFSPQTEPRLVEKIQDPHMHFDARVFNVPSTAEALQNLLWRSAFDCPRNALSLLARAHFSAKALHGLGRSQQRAKLAEIGVRFEDQPLEYTCGSYVKRQRFFKRTLNPVTGEEVMAHRHRIVVQAFNLGTVCASPEGLAAAEAWVFAKTWEAEALPGVVLAAPASSSSSTSTSSSSSSSTSTSTSTCTSTSTSTCTEAGASAEEEL